VSADLVAELGQGKTPDELRQEFNEQLVLAQNRAQRLARVRSIIGLAVDQCVAVAGGDGQLVRRALDEAKADARLSTVVTAEVVLVQPEPI
jgi:hypothetical protein